jgi:hypothetical protein
VELVARGGLSASSCVAGGAEARCNALGPIYGGELLVLYRPSPYFAFGGAGGYGRATGSLASRNLSAETLSFAVVGRVYLLEEGTLDPYFEALFGWGSERTTLTEATVDASPGRAPAANGSEADAAFGPLGRAGGGVDWLVGPELKLGIAANYAELVLARGETCRAGRCLAGPAPSGSVRGSLSVGLGLSLLLGQAL